MRADTAYGLQVGAGGPRVRLDVAVPAHPSGFPPTEVIAPEPEAVEPGVTLLTVNQGFPVVAGLFAVDADGEIIWHMVDEEGRSEIPNIDVFTRLEDGRLAYLLHAIIVVNVLGEVVQVFDPDRYGHGPYHHELIELPNGNLVTLGIDVRSISGYPGNATYDVAGDVIVELEPDGDLVREIKLLDILDPFRIHSPIDFHFPFGGRGKDWSPRQRDRLRRA